MQGSGDQYLKVEDAARRIGTSEYTVRKWLRQGKLKGTKLGGVGWRIAESEVQRLLSGEEAK